MRYLEYNIIYLMISAHITTSLDAQVREKYRQQVSPTHQHGLVEHLLLEDREIVYNKNKTDSCYSNLSTPILPSTNPRGCRSTSIAYVCTKNQEDIAKVPALTRLHCDAPTTYLGWLECLISSPESAPETTCLHRDYRCHSRDTLRRRIGLGRSLI